MTNAARNHKQVVAPGDVMRLRLFLAECLFSKVSGKVRGAHPLQGALLCGIEAYRQVPRCAVQFRKGRADNLKAKPCNGGCRYRFEMDVIEAYLEEEAFLNDQLPRAEDEKAGIGTTLALLRPGDPRSPDYCMAVLDREAIAAAEGRFKAGCWYFAGLELDEAC